MLWLDFDGRAQVMRGATRVRLRGADGLAAAAAIGTAAIHALARA